MLSYGSTAPLAALPENPNVLGAGWEARPAGRVRLYGGDGDAEDNFLKELLIAGTLLERKVRYMNDMLVIVIVEFSCQGRGVTLGTNINSTTHRTLLYGYY